MRSGKSASKSASKSETWLLLPLLPIFVVGAPPMLLFALLGFAGVILLGILMICVGLSIACNANSDFSEQVIVHGYAHRSERALHATDLHSANRFALVVDTIGAGLMVVGLCGFLYSGT
jgi:hypothetical protein